MDIELKPLASYPSENWGELFTRLEELRGHDPQTLSEVRGGEKVNGVLQMPWVDYARPVERIIELLYSLNVVQGMDWNQWLGDITVEEALNVNRIKSANLGDTVALLVSFVRAERFSDGVIGERLKDGTLVAALTRLEELVTSS
jgi:hypothetical protein